MRQTYLGEIYQSILSSYNTKTTPNFSWFNHTGTSTLSTDIRTVGRHDFRKFFGKHAKSSDKTCHYIFYVFFLNIFFSLHFLTEMCWKFKNHQKNTYFYPLWSKFTLLLGFFVVCEPKYIQCPHKHTQNLQFLEKGNRFIHLSISSHPNVQKGIRE